VVGGGVCHAGWGAAGLLVRLALIKLKIGDAHHLWEFRAGFIAMQSLQQLGGCCVLFLSVEGDQVTMPHESGRGA